MSTLICSDCQHENEAERIYCHNCGARLDRTKLIKEKVAAEPEAQTQNHLKKMFDPRRDRMKQATIKFCKMLLGAVATAAVVVMILPPADLPPEGKSDTFAPMISMDLVSATSSSQPATLVYSEEQVNSYLVSALRKDKQAGAGYLPLRRVWVRFREDECEVNTTRQFFALSIYSGGTYQVRLVNGKILTRAKGGYIGRMPIHSSLAQLTDLLLQKAWTGLDHERHSVAKLSKIEFHPQSVTLMAGR